MLRRLRSHDDDEEDSADAAAAGGPSGRGDEWNGAPAVAAGNNAALNNNQELARLLSRLQNERSLSNRNNHLSASNNNNNDPNNELSPADIERARYLLEATAGNVGLASWLYWEDYGVAASAGGYAAMNPSGGVAELDAAVARASGGARFGANDAAVSSAIGNAALSRNATDQSNALAAKQNNDSSSEAAATDDDERKPSSRTHDWEEAVQRALAESRRLHQEPASHADGDSSNHGENEYESVADYAREAPAIPNAPQPRVRAVLNLDTLMNPNPAAPPNPHAERVRNPQLQAPPAALPLHPNPPNNPDNPFQLNPMPPIPPRISDLMSRLLSGGSLNQDERRELMNSISRENRLMEMDRLLNERAAAARNAAIAAARDPNNAVEGRGNNDEADDDSNEESDGHPWNNHAPLRRSGRLRARRRHRRHHNDPAIPIDRRRHDAAISDDDGDFFVPGPDPVFREIVSVAAKRKRDEETDNNNKVDTKHLHGGEEDNDTVISDCSSVDGREFFNEVDESLKPLEYLWNGVRGERMEDDEEMTCIPQSWLQTGFVLSECGNGLAAAIPSEEDEGMRCHSPFSFLSHHCMGLSALLSTVTALIYSGASIRGTAVTCDADRTPFDKLSIEQRKKEFPKRLIDALSSLIFLAAQSMSARCAEALIKMDKRHAYRRKKHVLSQEDEDEFTLIRLKMARRVRQCRVCSWRADTNHEGPAHPRGKRVHSSLTNIEDIQSYVRSHLRSFMEPGGCALFLETIVRCHGTTYFQRVFGTTSEEALGKKSLEDAKVSLIRCKCQKTLQCYEKGGKGKSMRESLQYTSSPEEHNCIPVELLSLLLTGQSHSNYEHWCADNLGIGLLCIDKKRSIGPRLIRPEKPIWICLGDIGYSTLMLDKENFVGNVSSLDEPGKAFRLFHWDCWTARQTSMKVIPSIYDRLSTDHTISSVVSDTVETPKRTVTESIAVKMFEEQKRDTADSWCSNIFNPSPRHDVRPITDEELQSIRVHPDDPTFYPEEYRRWRYSIDSNNDWTSFFRLSGREKLLVEMKLAPRICVLVRTRWPFATVRDFSCGEDGFDTLQSVWFG